MVLDSGVLGTRARAANWMGSCGINWSSNSNNLQRTEYGGLLRRTESYCSIVELLHARSCNTGGAGGCQSIALTLSGLCVVDGSKEFRYCPVRRHHQRSRQYQYIQPGKKKTSTIPVPSRPASSHLVGSQKGYGVALAQHCGLQLLVLFHAY